MRIAGIALLLLIMPALSGSILPSVGAAAAEEYPFTVEPVYPENQVEPDVGYWYVNAAEGQKQNLEAIVRNASGKEIVVFIEAADCYTSTGGDLCYVTANKSRLIGLSDERFMLAGMIGIPVVKHALKPGEKVKLSFPVTAPAIDEGEALGGIRFFVATTVQNPERIPIGSAPQFNLNIRNAVTITVRLRYGSPGNLPAEGLSIGDAGFDSETGALYFYLSNLFPIINRNARGYYEVHDHDGNRLFGGAFDLVRMAPKSFVRVPVIWDHTLPEPGTYVISVQPEGALEPQVRTVELGDDEIEMIDENEPPPGSAPQGPGIAADNMLMLYGGWILFGVTFMLVVAFYIARKNKRIQ